MTVASLMCEPLLAADCPVEATVVDKPYSPMEEVERYIIQKPETDTKRTSLMCTFYLMSQLPTKSRYFSSTRGLDVSPP